MKYLIEIDYIESSISKLAISGLPTLEQKKCLQNLRICISEREKYEKARDIMITKNVSYPFLKMYKNNLEFYNMEMSEERRLTREEFELLKEVYKLK